MSISVEEIENIRQKNLDGGGISKIEKQHEKGSLTARERIDRLVDPGSFEELGSWVRDTYASLDDEDDVSPYDGVIIGYGKINSREVCVYSVDATVMSGSVGSEFAWKIADIMERAGKARIPLIGMLDSAGTRFGLRDGKSGFYALNCILRNLSLYSGVIPQIQLVFGPTVGLIAYAAVLSDFLIMTKDNARLWLGGSVETEEAGNAEFHMEQSGSCDIVAENDEDAIEKAKNLLGYIPQNCWQKPILIETDDDPNRRDEELLTVLPEDSRFTYDIREVIKIIVDNGEFLEIKGDYAQNIVVGFCRFGGYSVGLVANNPDDRGGILEPDSSDKYYRFMTFLNAFNIPLITLTDTTAFMPGDEWERRGVVRHGGRLLYAYATMTVPKISIVIRRSYGGANLVMGSKTMGSDFYLSWPGAEMAPTGPNTAVQAVYNKELEEAQKEGRYDEVYNKYKKQLERLFSVSNYARSYSHMISVQEVIDPRDTRRKLIRALDALANKREDMPDKKHGVEPM